MADRGSYDDVVIPFIFVPYGEEPPAEWLARHSDLIRIPATFVPHDPREPGTRSLESTPISDLEPADDRHVAAPSPEQVRETVFEDPIAAYRRIDADLYRMGLGHIQADHAANDFSGLAANPPSIPDRRSVRNADSQTAAPRDKIEPRDTNAPVQLLDDQAGVVLNRVAIPSCDQRASTLTCLFAEVLKTEN